VRAAPALPARADHVREEPKPADITTSMSPRRSCKGAERQAKREAPSACGRTSSRPYRAHPLSIAIAGSAIFLPLAVFDYLRGKVAISGLLLCLVLMLASTPSPCIAERRPPIPIRDGSSFRGARRSRSRWATQGIYGVCGRSPWCSSASSSCRAGFANVVSLTLLLAGVAMARAVAGDRHHDPLRALARVSLS
jgi:hypothetical protein